ncbi:MAG: hypothetical protein RBT02_10585 [Bacteroidales bacterium]|jgi:hypothetical protein|nr:hypothetical protein [Bacteroidales bacterium]
MKTAGYSLIIGAMAIMLSAVTVSGQTTQPSSEQQKQKEAEIQKKLQTMSEEEQQKLKQAEIEARKKGISEQELKKKVAEIEAASEERKREFERQFRDYEDIRRSTGDITKDFNNNFPMVVMPDEKVFKYVTPSTGDIYIYSGHGYGSKPGSSWNYSRQVMEATFTNELTMSAGDESNVNLSVSGDCAEGSITVSIIMPDGKQLSEVVLDENGSLNWRKNYEAGENNGWKNGKWVFRIKAKNATGNLRISMNSD